MTDELETASLGISACYKGLRGTQASRRSEKAFALLPRFGYQAGGHPGAAYIGSLKEASFGCHPSDRHVPSAILDRPNLPRKVICWPNSIVSRGVSQLSSLPLSFVIGSCHESIETSSCIDGAWLTVWRL